jgi:polar amino acid transport system substrate-binding protein
MRKFITAFAVLSMAGVILTGCGSKGNEVPESTESSVATSEDVTEETTKVAEGTDADEEKNTDGKTFTLGFDANFPPYGYVDEEGNYVGFDLDLAAEVCNRLGWELVLQPIDWDSKDMELESGAIDCIWSGFTMSDDRLDKYAWSKPYVDNSQVFVVAKDSDIKTPADLAGKVVAVQADSSALEALESDDHADLKASFAELMQVPEYNTGFMNLESGAVDAIAMDIGVANYQISTRNDNFVILEEPLVSEQYGIGFKLGNEEMRDQVQSTLDEMAADGTIMTIADEWTLAESVILGK